ncbi:hypothetical protein TREES_T100014957 [Tupaia chinensis]|uniref:Uncharacterized protein n=1 Tax=Tupaia chinensis TaxID=246437 RepID=L9KPZ6_TUPCH|nr:hypothetical protein TREES_T100014957 [Tupaia chinensis]
MGTRASSQVPGHAGQLELLDSSPWCLLASLQPEHLGTRQDSAAPANRLLLTSRAPCWRVTAEQVGAQAVMLMLTTKYLALLKGGTVPQTFSKTTEMRGLEAHIALVVHDSLKKTNKSEE